MIKNIFANNYKKICVLGLTAIFITSLMSGLFVFSNNTFADSNGPRNAGTGVDDSGTGTIPWTSPGNIVADDTNYATAALTNSNKISHYLKATNFDFSSIPTGATINGISVSYYRTSNGTLGNLVQDNIVKLVKGGAIVGSNYAQTGSTYWVNAGGLIPDPANKWETATYGGASDKWGESWIAADIKSSNFGVVISAKNITSSNVTAWVDYVQITVNYTLSQYNLHVSKGGSGTGVVTSAPAGINCGGTCDYSYNQNTQVTLTANPDLGSSFDGWSGDCIGGTCVVTMGADKSVTATFNLLPYCGDGNLDQGEICEQGKQQSCITQGGYNGTQYCLSDCSGWDECQPSESCGDHIINDSEQCEDPNTSDNTYCSQSTTQCASGNKTQTRDSYGNCNGTCGCAYDNWSTSTCVKDSCNASCAEAADCNDSNPSTTDYCNLDTCQCENTQIPLMTIIASKVICDNEADLPNWGNGGPNITSSTASVYVNQHSGCHLVQNWGFEWAYQNVSNPGDNIIGPAGGNWNLFDISNPAEITSLEGSSNEIWVREVFQDGYVTFTGNNETQDQSAEFYCHEDVLKYDNYDSIDEPHLDTTYYCVGFNTPIRYTCDQSSWTCEVSAEGTDLATCTSACHATPTPLGSIAGYKYNDLNQDGIHDAGEPGLGGWTIFVDINDNGQKDIGDIQYITNENGYYGLPNVPVGTYDVCEITDDHPGWTNSGPICQNVVVTQDNTTPVDFFNYEVPTGDIVGHKYNDLDKDGEWDEGELGLGGWNICVDGNTDGDCDDPKDVPQTTTSSGENDLGFYSFRAIPAGSYQVCEIIDEHTDWAASENSVCQEVEVIAGIENSADFFNYVIPTSGSLTICKYGDKGVIGQYEPGTDLPVEAWEMRVDNNYNYNQLHYTGADGCVTISGLDFGSYTVSETLPSGWAQMYPSNGTGNHSQTVDLNNDNPSESVYFLNYYMTSLLPTMYACNSSTLRCAIDGSGQFGSLQGCQDACGASAGPGGQYVAVVLGAATEQGGAGQGQGQVAGASIGCNPYLLKYIKLGADNDPEEVKKLESFLNEYLGVDLPVNGIFEEADYNAVKQFQLLLKDDVLAPWVLVGCLPSDISPTGYVYRTTKWTINNFFCPELKPDVSDEKCEGVIIIGLGEEEGTVLGEATTTPTTTTETTPPETTGETGTNVAPENGAKPSQNWLWYLIGIIVIGGAVSLAYSRRKK